MQHETATDQLDTDVRRENVESSSKERLRQSMRSWSRNLSNRTPLFLLAFVEFASAFTSVYAISWFVHGSISTANAEIGLLHLKALIVSSMIVISLTAMGLYHFHQRLYFREVLARVSVGIALGSLVLAAAYFLFPVIALPREVLTLTVIGALAIVLLARLVFFRSVDANVFRLRTMVYGAGDRAKGVDKLRRRADRRGFRIVRSIPAPGDKDYESCNDTLSLANSVARIAQEDDIDEIVVAMDDRRGNIPLRQLLECKLSGINVIDIAEFLERESGKVRVDLVSPSSLIFSKGFRTSGLRRFGKRMADLAISGVSSLFLWPLFLATVIAIKWEEGLRAPVFYRQTRVGQYGAPFSIIKFRSMVENAESTSGAVWAEEGDPRVTKVGKILRKFRVDELPQLLNVLKGDMSIVGPRPERPQFVNQLAESIPYYLERHTVKPGITGWAQLRYPYGSTEEDALEKMQYDLYYVKHQSLILDLIIMLQTVEVVVWGKGAR